MLIKFSEWIRFIAQIEEFVHSFPIGLCLCIAVDNYRLHHFIGFLESISQNDFCVRKILSKISFQGFRRRNMSSSGFEI